MTAQHPTTTTTSRPPRPAWQHAAQPPAPRRTARAGFALPTVRELPRPVVRDAATW